MFARFLLCALVAALALSGCSSAEKKKKKDEAAALKKNEKTAMPDVSGDTAFQAFVGHLHAAVLKKDRNEIASMLAPDFGYRWDAPPAGETPFDYWDKHNLWAELEQILTNKFVPHESYMVAPAKFVTDPTYRGYRAGIRNFGGSWKLAYFINGEDVLQ